MGQSSSCSHLGSLTGIKSASQFHRIPLIISVSAHGALFRRTRKKWRAAWEEPSSYFASLIFCAILVWFWKETGFSVVISANDMRHSIDHFIRPCLLDIIGDAMPQWTSVWYMLKVDRNYVWNGIERRLWVIFLVKSISVQTWLFEIDFQSFSTYRCCLVRISSSIAWLHVLCATWQQTSRKNSNTPKPIEYFQIDLLIKPIHFSYRINKAKIYIT